jgi:gamma-glutamyltranspeptidase/glutathione hydrolase
VLTEIEPEPRLDAQDPRQVADVREAVRGSGQERLRLEDPVELGELFPKALVGGTGPVLEQVVVGVGKVGEPLQEDPRERTRGGVGRPEGRLREALLQVLHDCSRLREHEALVLLEHGHATGRVLAVDPARAVVEVDLDRLVRHPLFGEEYPHTCAVRAAGRIVERQHLCDASAMSRRPASPRPPAEAANAMVATSQPLATRAGLRALERGGNAADAALAAAAMLCVAEPMSTGVGGDAFAIVWRNGEAIGLDAAGPAPASADPVEPVEEHGPRSVTVPGAVAGWALLAERFGRLGLDACLSDAVDAAENGVAAGIMTSRAWVKAGSPPEFPSPPTPGGLFRLPELAQTLRLIADEGPSAIYEGEVASAIACVSWLKEEDLAGMEAQWVEPLRGRYRDVEVLELPPPTQGVAALEGLGLLDLGEATLPDQIECLRLALKDALAHVRDGADVSRLLEPTFLGRRREESVTSVAEPRGGTVYFCAVDENGMAVSFIQSLYDHFGSGLVLPGTGIVLQNRGACFDVSGRVEPGRRPFHTIIPGLLLRDGGLLGPFGVMGAFMQAQGHVQLVSGLVDAGLDPQAAIDRPRFRVRNDEVHLEEGLWERAGELEGLGFKVVKSREPDFGGAQAIMVEDDALLGGSDLRKDGYAAGL